MKTTKNTQTIPNVSADMMAQFQAFLASQQGTATPATPAPATLAGTIAKNYDVRVTPDNKMIITIDLVKNQGYSSTGKSILVSSTGSKFQVADNKNNVLTLNLNLYKKL